MKKCVSNQQKGGHGIDCIRTDRTLLQKNQTRRFSGNEVINENKEERFDSTERVFNEGTNAATQQR